MDAYEVARNKLQRHYAELLEHGLAKIGRRNIQVCADPRCKKPYVPWRSNGGRIQEFCTPECAKRLRQREYKRRQKES
jgi:hypothetical protein